MRALDEVRDVVTGLHPAFYVLLAMAIAALATATLPASSVPSPLGATLARRRAELTLAGDPMMPQRVYLTPASFGRILNTFGRTESFGTARQIQLAVRFDF